MADEKEVPAPGTMETRVAEIRARLAGVTAGPWFVWDGHGYFLGGRDLCIGAGPEWLANMDHRACDKRSEHMVLSQFLQGNVPLECSPEEHTRLVSIAETFEDCPHDEAFTAEQMADAQFIARAREDVPFLLALVAYLDKQTDELSSENWRLRHSGSEDLAPADPDGLRAHREAVLAELHKGNTVVVAHGAKE